MGGFIDMTGFKSERLTVLERAPNKGNTTMWLCMCECGTLKAIPGTRIRDGSTKSCGCLQKEIVKNRMTKHGFTGSRFYRIWQAMHTRCSNEKDKHFNIYGGRGITVSSCWDDFVKFKSDMYDSYISHVQEFGESNTSIDRIDVNKGYSFENCRWSTNLEQVRNRRSKTGYPGVQLASDKKTWIANIGINYKRIYLGSYKEIEDAIKARKEAENHYWKGII